MDKTCFLKENDLPGEKQHGQGAFWNFSNSHTKFTIRAAILPVLSYNEWMSWLLFFQKSVFFLLK